MDTTKIKGGAIAVLNAITDPRAGLFLAGMVFSAGAVNAVTGDYFKAIEPFGLCVILAVMSLGRIKVRPMWARKDSEE